MWTCKDMLLSNIETMACCEKVQNIHFQDRKQFLKIKLLQMPSAVIVSSTVIFQTHIQPKFSETKRCDSRIADLNNAFTHKLNCWGADFNCARVSADPRDRSWMIQVGGLLSVDINYHNKPGDNWPTFKLLHLHHILNEYITYLHCCIFGAVW